MSRRPLLQSTDRLVRGAAPERVFLLGVEFSQQSIGGRTRWAVEESLAELMELAASAGGEVVGQMSQTRPAPDAATLIGRGKVQELKAALEATGADLTIVDQDLSPTQQRNLEQALERRVVDRTQLILDIFARHARTREGQLQVELAMLRYRLPRLAGRGVAMSRLGGGIGTRGPGETQLESDRRRLQQRIRKLESALEAVRQQRGRQRQKREAVPLATAALVGYTNAGKSTLFNRITGAEVTASPRMFATLDPTVRALRLPSHRRILLSDTVGFLRDLPHGLISAFHATLEEVQRASLLLLVLDASSPDRDLHRAQVERVLGELEASHTPRLEVWNKADRLSQTEREALRAPMLEQGGEAPLRIGISALTGEGLPELLAAMDRKLPLDPIRRVHLQLPHGAGKLLHALYESGVIYRAEANDDGLQVVADVPASLLKQLTPYWRDEN